MQGPFNGFKLAIRKAFPTEGKATEAAKPLIDAGHVVKLRRTQHGKYQVYMLVYYKGFKQSDGQAFRVPVRRKAGKFCGVAEY